MVGGGGTPSTPRVLKESWCLHRGGFGPPPHNLSATRMVPGCLKFPTSGALHQKLLFFLPPKSCILGHFFRGGGAGGSRADQIVFFCHVIVLGVRGGWFPHQERATEDRVFLSKDRPLLKGLARGRSVSRKPAGQNSLTLMADGCVCMPRRTPFPLPLLLSIDAWWYMVTLIA